MQSESVTRRYAQVAAIGAVLFAPLLATSYFRTSDGSEEKTEAVFTGWVDGVENLAGSLLDLASPDTMYSIFSLAFAVLFPAVLLSALAIYRTRPAGTTRPERWGWRVALVGYTIFFLGGVLAGVTMLFAGVESSLTNVWFLALMFPGMLISLIGSTMLGVALIRARFSPRATAWVLALAIPLAIMGSIVLGHNSFAIVPLFVAWAISA